MGLLVMQKRMFATQVGMDHQVSFCFSVSIAWAVK